jgi:hypothetical protein
MGRNKPKQIPMDIFYVCVVEPSGKTYETEVQEIVNTGEESLKKSAKILPS